jgi:antitoxin (DNA-binding transcriptional repressor) of toxin-antitoxin stability system
MKTLTVTQGRQNLGHWLKRALCGDDVGFLVDGHVVALRPVQVHSDDYALQEYGATEAQVARAFKTVRNEVRRARVAGTTKRFTGKL